MTVTLNLDPETEKGLLTQALEHGLSLDVYLEEMLRQASINNAGSGVARELIEIPLLHLGVVSPLRRRDIYDDIYDDAH